MTRHGVGCPEARGAPTARGTLPAARPGYPCRMAVEETPPDDARERLLRAAAALLEAGGSEALSTRAVSAAAGVQAPTLYRLFGDKQGLLDALASHGFSRYLLGKGDVGPAEDPVDDLRSGWDIHVGLGLANPALYGLMYDTHRAGRSSPAAAAAFDVLAARIHRIAAAGRLRVTESRAIQLVHAAGHGTTLLLIATPREDRDMEVSRLAREAVLAAITTGAGSVPDAGAELQRAAVTLRALVPQADALSAAERGLLGEWLDRLAP